MSQFKRGGIWWYKVEKDGVCHRRSTGSRSKAVAVSAERVFRNELDLSRNGIPAKHNPIKFPKAAEEWMEAKRARWGKANLAIQQYNLKHLLPYFGASLLTSITAGSIGVYQAERQDEGASNRTINMELGTLRMILKHNKLWRAIEDAEDAPRMLTANKNVGKALTFDEEARLFAACGQSLQPSLAVAVIVFSNTGLRNGELRKARWSQVDFLKKKFTVGKAKTEASSNRVVPLNSAALDVLTVWRARWPLAKPEDFIFPSEKLKRGQNGQMISYAVDKAKPLGSWKTAWKTAKAKAVVECRMHDLRHSVVTALAVDGVAGAVVRSISGHTTAQMQELYEHVEQDEQRKALDGLAAKRQAAQAKLAAPERVQ
jgi:integrase